MLEDSLTLDNPIFAAAGLATVRKPQRPTGVRPEGLTIISSDNHLEINEDIFIQNFPAELKAAAPRVWFDRYWHVGYKGELEAFGLAEEIGHILENITLSEGFDFKVRHKHLEAEGIDKEIVYPQSLLGFIRYPDLRMQELMYRTYNEWLARLEKQDPGRFYGVAVCSNWWDPERAEAAMRQIVDLGLKTFIIPISPGKHADGTPIDYASPEMDRFWSAVEDAGLPVSYHIGENPSFEGRGAFGTNFLVQAAPFRKTLGRLIFGGILDRHPRLQVVFAEGGLNWAASALQDAELTLDVHSGVYDMLPKHRPSYYWHNHCYATFQVDAIGMQLLPQIGADRVMWAQDYPHSEGTMGVTWDMIGSILDSTSEAKARLILGDTAAKLYKF